jgi:hypothetical protein
MMKNLRFIFAMMVVLLILAFSNAKAQPVESCLKMICTNDLHDEYDSLSASWHCMGGYNPDSVKIDSCNNSATFGKVFANRYFQLCMNFHYYPFDKVIDTSDVFEIKDISNSKSELKQQFQKLEDKFGKVYIRGAGNEYLETKESILGNPIFRMFFKDYQDIEAVEQYVHKNLDSVRYFEYNRRYANDLTKVTEGIFSSTSLKINPNPAQNKLSITIDGIIPYELIKIYSMDGILVKELNYQSEIDISDLTSGVYFIKYGYQSGKFVKE